MIQTLDRWKIKHSFEKEKVPEFPLPWKRLSWAWKSVSTNVVLILNIEKENQENEFQGYENPPRSQFLIHPQVTFLNVGIWTWEKKENYTKEMETIASK